MAGPAGPGLSLPVVSRPMIFSHPLVSLALALGDSDPEVRLGAARQLTHRLGEPGFLELLRHHRLTPLVYATLSGLKRAAVGQVPFLEELRRDYGEQLRGYRVQERETLVVAKALTAAGVEVILLKGGDIRHRLYDDPVCRPMGDVDLLIAPAALDQARAVLRGLGYRLVLKDRERSPEFNRRFAWEELYAGPGGSGVFVDLHWEIRKMGAFYRLPYSLLRLRARPAEDLKGMFTLAPEHLLMNLCLNTLEELEQAGIMKVVDLDRALGRLPLDWELFLADAAALRIEGPLGVILAGMAHLRPQAIPKLVLDRLAAYKPSWLERRILQRTEGSLVWASVAALGRHVPVREWPAFLRGKLWPEPAFIRVNYGSRLNYLRHLKKRWRHRA